MLGFAANTSLIVMETGVIRMQTCAVGQYGKKDW